MFAAELICTVLVFRGVFAAAADLFSAAGWGCLLEVIHTMTLAMPGTRLKPLLRVVARREIVAPLGEGPTADKN